MAKRANNKPQPMLPLACVARKPPLRRMVNPVIRRVATRLDVVFEELLDKTPQLVRESDQPALAAGWFRLIRLKRV